MIIDAEDNGADDNNKDNDSFGDGDEKIWMIQCIVKIVQVPKGGSSSPMAGIVRVPPLLYPEQLHWYIVEQSKLHKVDNYCMISGKLELLGWRQISNEKQIKQIVFKYNQVF